MKKTESDTKTSKLSGLLLDPIDAHVGAKIRARRMIFGMSQVDLGKSIGVTFQQIQKYEKGVNHISISRLYQVSRTLKVPLSYFFDGITSDLKSRHNHGFSDNTQEGFDVMSEAEDDIMKQRDVLKLIKAYSNIKDEKLRRQLLQMAQTMAETD